MQYTRITFPDLRLRARDGHKLRGYFGRLFAEHSPLLHNHEPGGRYRYAYPLVQYKVLDGIPTVLGLGAGSALLTRLFLRVDRLEIEDLTLPVRSKEIHSEEVQPRVNGQLYAYRFVNPWLALNQDNHRRYRQAEATAQQALLQRLLTNHLVAVVKALGGSLDERVLVHPQLRPLRTQFKNQPMLAFSGHFVTNVWLPDAIGLGKSVSRGFGAVRAQNERER
ncbi:MAG: DNA repair protein [Bacteroidetes bacterium]|nr:MAG: DNA repair protein [Bacteroidota bacterium]